MIGNPILPVIKLCANPRTVRTMGEHIDVDVSGLLRKEMNPDRRATLLDCMFRTANGRLTAAEALDIASSCSRASTRAPDTAERGYRCGVRMCGAAARTAGTAFEVPRRPSQTVLDVVTHIQRHLDATLSYRFACRVGMCGSCAMTVNGAARWTCRTHVDSVAAGGSLASARSPTCRWSRTWSRTCAGSSTRGARPGPVQGSKTRREAFARVDPASAARREADAAIECIGCGVCYASCDVVAWNPEYLGPAALNRAWTLVSDARDTGQKERLLAVSGDAGCHSCHTHMSCTELCPKKLSPTRSIAGLKRASLKLAFMPEDEA